MKANPNVSGTPLDRGARMAFKTIDLTPALGARVLDENVTGMRRRSRPRESPSR
jgi:hypothetical protein